MSFVVRLDRTRWRKARLAVLKRDGFRCRKCGKAGRLEVDHVRPLWRVEDQDAYAPAGLQALCRGCHIDKSRGERREARPASTRAWDKLIADRMA